jgi:hypothetical protein
MCLWCELKDLINDFLFIHCLRDRGLEHCIDDWSCDDDEERKDLSDSDSLNGLNEQKLESKDN